MIPQSRTEQIMRDRLAELGGHVEFGRELVGFEQDEDGVTARVVAGDREETLRVRYLVATDGGRSFVRRALGLDFPGKTLGVRAMVADVALTGMDGKCWKWFNEGDMQWMHSICPLGGTDLFKIQAPVPPEGEVDLSAAGLQQMVTERTGRMDILVHSVSWASAYEMNARLAARYRVDRVFLAGDAAHIHPPTGGQGLNTSVQDAYNLGWKLAAVLRGAPDDLLDTYESERRPVAEDMLGLSTRLLDAGRRGDIRRGREVRQLDIGYPDSPLNLEGSARMGRLRAGDRAPDAPVAGAAGQPTRLFQLFKGTHWTLLINGEHAFRPRAGLHLYRLGDRGDIIDTGNHVRDAYALADGECVLVRPDGYVAAITSLDAEGISQLEAFLERVGLTIPGEAGQ